MEHAARLHLGRLDEDEAGELAITHALLRRASSGDLTATYRVYSPRVPTVVFGRRDTRLPGFGAAVDAARGHGFDTAVRVVGGRVVAYTPACVVVEHVRHDPHPGAGLDRRFELYGNRITAELRRLGVDAHLGRVTDEYCPGDHSVNARGVVKLVGTAQRVVPHAWLFSALAMVDDAAAVRAVLTDVHARLDLPFDPASVGALVDEDPTVTSWAVGDALLAAGGGGHAVPTALDEGTREAAATLVADHRLP